MNYIPIFETLTQTIEVPMWLLLFIISYSVIGLAVTLKFILTIYRTKRACKIKGGRILIEEQK